MQTSNRTTRFGHHHDRLTSRPPTHPTCVLPMSTSHLSTFDGSQGHVLHCKRAMHEDGLLAYILRLHHKDNAIQAVQAAANSPCSWESNRGPLQTFLRARPLTSVVKDRAMANPHYAIRNLHLRLSTGDHAPFQQSHRCMLQSTLASTACLPSFLVRDRTRWVASSLSTHLYPSSGIITHHY